MDDIGTPNWMAARPIPVEEISPSPTNPRKRFDPTAIAELAESIIQVGVIQPVLVRPMPNGKHRTQPYELVAGERRYQATLRAGLTVIPAIVRELNDAQVIELQVTENLQREDLDALEEAHGYRALMDIAKLKAEEVGARIGKSRAYVYARLKLLDLSPAPAQALQDGKLDPSKALLIARLPTAKLQRQALALVAGWEGEHYSYRELFDRLRRKFMADLKEAPFARHDATLRPEIGPCTTCASCSANDPELLDGLKGNADVCTDRPCFEAKIRAYWKRRREDAESSGAAILKGDDAKKCFLSFGGLNGYAALTDEIEVEPEIPPNASDEEEQRIFESFQAPTVREVVGDAPTVLIESPRDGKLIEAVSHDELRRALAAKGIAVPDHMYGGPREDTMRHHVETPQERDERQAKEKAKQDAEIEFRQRLLRAIAQKWKGPLKRADLQELVIATVERDHREALAKVVYGGKLPDIFKASDEDLARMLVLARVAGAALDTWVPSRELVALATRLKIDTQQVKRELRAPVKSVAAKSPSETKASAPKKPKKKPVKNKPKSKSTSPKKGP